MADVVMPRLSDSMEEGTVLRWLKSEGDEVHRGEELVEIETDKANMTYEADGDGALHIVAQEGDTLAIGEVIATLGGDGAQASQDGGAESGQETGEQAAPAEQAAPGGQSAAAEQAAPGEQAAPSERATSGSEPPAPPRRAPSGADGADGASGERIKASPVARRMARERAVGLAGVSGTGPGGRIVKADVEALAGDQAATPAEAPAAEPTEAPAAPPAEPEAPPAAAPVGGEPAAGAKGEARVEQPDRSQQLIARRMAEAKATVPEFTLQAEVDMDGAVALRDQLKEVRGEDGGPTPSFNDMIVKASAIALREHSRANGAYRDGHFELYPRVNVGIAVAAPGTLVVPTVFDADRKSLGEIARESRALAERVRARTVTPPELSGATFTVSNLGMYGVSNFTAIINPPQAAILAVGAIREVPVVRDGELVPGRTMGVTLACDHRILYGADAARFLARIVALLEQPLALAL